MKKITITKRWLEKHNACLDGMEWFENQTETDPAKLANIALRDGHFSWVNWAITRKMNKAQKVRYAIFAAELVLDIYNKKYPDDERPKKAIEAAKAYLKRPSKRTKKAADAAAYAAYDAAYAANAANAAYAAYAAAYAANAAYAAYAAASYAAADDAANAAYAAAEKRIIEYGIKLLMDGA